MQFIASNSIEPAIPQNVCIRDDYSDKVAAVNIGYTQELSIPTYTL
jgi:hypothetical protein